MVNQLVGFGAGGEESVQLVSSVSLGDSGLDTSSYTFSSIGLTGSWTHLIITTSNRGLYGTATVSSLTVNGVGATEVVSASDGTAIVFSNIMIIASSAASPEIIVNLSAAANNIQLHVYAVTGLRSTTAVATNNTGTANPSVLDLSTSAGGIAIAGGQCLNATSCSWSGVTETHDDIRDSSFNYSGGYALTTTAESPRTITATWSGTANYRITVSAAFR